MPIHTESAVVVILHETQDYKPETQVHGTEKV